MSIDIYRGLLKMFEVFDVFEPSSDNNLHFSYEFMNDNLFMLNDSYKINTIAGSGDDLKKAINILEWVSENIHHKGNYDGSLSNNSITLLNYSYQAGQERGINCRSLSTILTECCLSIGINARTIHIMLCSPYDGDNHVITSVYVKELRKWIMLDPTYNCYFRDIESNVLDMFEVRKILSEKGNVKFNEAVNYNGYKYDGIYTEILEYFTKNLFYFWCREHNTFGSDDGKGGRMIICSPFGYSVQKAKEINLHWRICQQGGYKEYMSILKEEISEEKIRMSKNDFMNPPIHP